MTARTSCHIALDDSNHNQLVSLLPCFSNRPLTSGILLVWRVSCRRNTWRTRKKWLLIWIQHANSSLNKLKNWTQQNFFFQIVLFQVRYFFNKLPKNGFHLNQFDSVTWVNSPINSNARNCQQRPVVMCHWNPFHPKEVLPQLCRYINHQIVSMNNDFLGLIAQVYYYIKWCRKLSCEN